MKKILEFFIFSLFCLFSLTEIQAQQVTIKPFAVNQSNLIGELKKLKIANPKIPVEEFVKSANTLLDKQGLNFTVGFDANTCQKIAEIKKAQKTPNAPLNLRTTLKSPLGESAALLLPEAEFNESECFPCFVTLSFLEITDKDFVTIVQDNNLKFFLPGNFLVNEVFLVDETDFKTVKNKWKIPFKTVPLSVSDEGNILFVGFDEPELSDLSLMIFSEGSYQFYAKKDLDQSKKGIVLKDSESKNTTPNFSYVKFNKEKVNQIVKFPVRCPD